MNPAAIAYVIFSVLGIALSLRSIAVLGTRAPWTSAGWLLTVLYFVAAIAKAGPGWILPAHGEYWFLIALTIAFVVAGVRDERQAEPWWWPNRCGETRAERRARISA